MNALTVVKKISWRLLFIILGFSIALLYVYLKLQRNVFRDKIATMQWVDLGKDDKGLMANYENEQKGIWPHFLRLRTGEKEEILRGFWIDKNMLDAIQKIVDNIPADPKPVINGYSVFLGKNEDYARGYYSLVVRATEGKKNVMTGGLDTLGVGNYFDMVDPCPDDCGGDDSRVQKK